MKALLGVVLLLSGCTSYSVMRSCPDKACVSYVEVTEAKASPFAILTTEAITCRVASFGDVGDWLVRFKGEHCEAVLNDKAVEF